MEQFLTFKKYPYFIAGILVFLGLYLASLYSYLLFHSLAEIFSIVVACGIFMVAWNSRRFLDNHYFLFIGIAYLFVGALDLTHTLAYKGMGVFLGYETNLPTQLWIAARYMESLSLFLAPFFLGRKLKVNSVFLGYTLATFLLLMSIFYWNIFPACFIEGVGLTSFKKISEYVISLILLGSIILLLKNRTEFERKVLQWVIWSIIVGIVSELAFTFYIDAYGFSNLIGHFFKILSFYFIYKAIIETGLTRPNDLLFRNLRRSEALLREEKNKIQNYLDIAGVILVVIDADQKVRLINKKGCEILGYDEREIIGKNWFDTFIPEKNRDEVKAEFRKLVDGEINAIEYSENPILTKSGEERIIAWHNAVLRDEKGDITSALSSGEDITERKRMEEELTRLASFPQLNPNPIVEVDLAGHVHYSNPAAHRLFPDLSKAGLNHPWLMDSEKIGEALKTEPRKTYVRELKVRDRWYQQTIHPVTEGTRLRIYGFDITERKQAEEAAKASEKRAYDQAARLQTVLDTAPAIIWIAGDRECKEITGNRASYVFLRVPEGTDMSKSGPAPERLAHYRVFKDGVELTAREMPIQRVAALGQGLSDYAMELVFNDGTVRSVLGNISPVLDSAGQPNGAIAAFIDITERKKTAEELRKSRDELELRVRERTTELANAYKELKEQSRILESFFKYTATPLVLLDRDFNFIRVNEAYAKACQRDVSEFPGHNHFEFYPSDAKAKFEQVVQTKEPYVAIAKPFAFPDHPEWGTSYWDWTLTPILDDAGETEFLVFSLEDVTKRKRAEEAVKTERQRFNDVLEMLPAYLVLLTPDYHVPFANRFFRERFGESHGKRCFEYLFGRSEPCEICETYTVLKTNARHGWEWTGPDGRYYDVFDFPFTDTDGSTLILEMGIDITERKRAEMELSVRARQEATIAQLGQSALTTTDLQTLQNETVALIAHTLEVEFCKILELLPEGAALLLRAGIGWKEGLVGHATVGTETNSQAGYTLLSHAPVIVEDLRTETRFSGPPLLHEHGVVSGMSVIVQGQGRPYGVLGVHTARRRKFTEDDVHFLQACANVLSSAIERKRVEEQLKAVHQYTRSLIEASPDPLVTINPEGKVMDVNRATELVTGILREQLIGSDFSDYFTIPEKAREGYRQVFGMGSVRDYPLAIRHTSGHITPVLYNATVYKNEAGEVQGVFAAARDITEQKRAEEALRESENRLRALSSQLLTAQESERKRIAMELHDGIGQMLTAIKFKVENVLQEKGKGRARAKDKSLEAVIPIVRESVEEVRRIQMDLRPSTLDDLGILATLEWFCREYQRIYSHIRIEKEIGLQESDVSIPLRTVIYRLTQEALNNIAKHSKADLVHLSLRKKGDTIEWVIKDDGMGFDLEDILSSERSRRGLGLNSMRERAELSGGTFEIETTLGVGTTIRANWPIVMG